MAGRRRSIVVEGLDHGGQPFPIATRVGPLVVTSAIHGRDPATGEFAVDPATQIRQVFANVAAVLEAAGGSMDDVASVQVLLGDLGHRGLVNDVWCETFPDPDDRPTRNTAQRDLTDPLVCQVIVTAMLRGSGAE